MPEGFSTAGLWQQEVAKSGVFVPSWRLSEPRFEPHSDFPDSLWKGNSQKFAPNMCGWHHADVGQASSEEDTDGA